MVVAESCRSCTLCWVTAALNSLYGRSTFIPVMNHWMANTTSMAATTQTMENCTFLF